MTAYLVNFLLGQPSLRSFDLPTTTLSNLTYVRGTNDIIRIFAKRWSLSGVFCVFDPLFELSLSAVNLAASHRSLRMLEIPQTSRLEPFYEALRDLKYLQVYDLTVSHHSRPCGMLMFLLDIAWIPGRIAPLAGFETYPNHPANQNQTC